MSSDDPKRELDPNELVGRLHALRGQFDELRRRL